MPTKWWTALNFLYFFRGVFAWRNDEVAQGSGRVLACAVREAPNLVLENLALRQQLAVLKLQSRQACRERGLFE